MVGEAGRVLRGLEGGGSGLKAFSVILTGSNMSQEAVPGLIKSVFRYLSEQRSLETFEFRIGGRRNMGMATFDNEMYNYKIGSQLRSLHI